MTKALLFCHALTGWVAVFALIHCCYWAFRFRRGDYARRETQKKLSNIACGLFLCTLTTGFLLVPAFETSVAPALAAAGRPFLVKLFQLKFYWAVLACFLCLATAAYRVSFDPEEDRGRLPAYTRFIATVTGAGLTVALIGLLLAIYQPIS